MTEPDTPLFDAFARHLLNLRQQGFRGPALERGAAIAAGLEEHLLARFAGQGIGDGPGDARPEEIEREMKRWMHAQGLT